MSLSLCVCVCGCLHPITLHVYIMCTLTPHLTSCAGANIAASWAALRSLGEDGYMQKAEQLMKTTLAMEEGVDSIQVQYYDAKKYPPPYITPSLPILPPPPLYYPRPILCPNCNTRGILIQYSKTCVCPGPVSSGILY